MTTLYCVSAACRWLYFFFFNPPPTTEIYTLSLHDALPILDVGGSPLVGEQIVGARNESEAGGDQIERAARRGLHLGTLLGRGSRRGDEGGEHRITRRSLRDGERLDGMGRGIARDDVDGRTGQGHVEGYAELGAGLALPEIEDVVR